VKAARSYKKQLVDWIYDKILTKPVPLLITVVFFIFITEIIVIFIISNLTSLSIISEAIIGSLMKNLNWRLWNERN
jgi:hypothetical protein